MSRSTVCYRRCLLPILLWASMAPLVGRAEVPFPEQLDRIIEAAHQRDGLHSAGLADDAEFVRRVYLDLTGVVPTPAQARKFLDDSTTEKRVRLIDRLVAAPEFSFHLARVFDAMLVERRVATISSPSNGRIGWLVSSA